MASRQSIHLFRLAGIDVYLHWTWFLIALVEIDVRRGAYSSFVWNEAEYLALFAIVLTHEFGHALACRQTGGTASRILLWPFGGVAYVAPPPRAGANLWSIAAGPLVNVALIAPLWPFLSSAQPASWAALSPDAYRFLHSVCLINLGLLIFNILPIYPLDGGQILRSLLWFVIGRGRSLMAATFIGFAGIAGLIGLAAWTRDLWLAAITIFMLLNCWQGLQHARALVKLARLPRRAGYFCPSCHTAPPVGEIWRCSCGGTFDTFLTGATCPRCHTRFPVSRCPECGAQSPIEEWAAAVPAPVGERA